MGTRPTKRAGIYKPRRVTDPEVLKALNAIIERLEVMDGIRGDSLDQAVTWRDLGNTGFVLGTGAGGTPTITNTPGPGTGDGGVPVPGIGPAGPPSNLAANETYLALLLTWDNTDFNLQHVEVWRNDKPDFSDASGDGNPAVLIGTTVSPQFIDYVGASASFYYWVRSVSTDGTYSAFNDTAGTLGTTGVDPGEIILDPDNFKLIDGVDVTNPFLVGTLADDTVAVGLDGTLLIKGSLRAEAIVAGTIGADQVSLNKVDGIFANFGTVQGGLIRTAAPNAFRVEIEDQAATFYPLWYGSGAKGDAGGLFYVTQNGDVVVRGLLDAAMIKQSLFTPSSPSNDQFKIATQYPSLYSGGSYTGKKAHLFPMKSSHYGPNEFPTGIPFGGSPSAFKATSNQCNFLSPLDTSTTEYGRLGQYANMFHFFVSLHVTLQYGYDIDYKVSLFYNYGSGSLASPWPEHTFYFTINGSAGVRSVSPSFSGTFRTKATAFSEFNCWFQVEQWSFPSGSTGLASSLRMFSSSVFTPNVGTADGTIKLLS